MRTTGQAPFVIRSLLFPFTMLSVVTSTWMLIGQGYEMATVMALTTFSGFFIVALCEYRWPLHPEWNRNTGGDLWVDALHFIHNGFWVRLAETAVRAGCAVIALKLAALAGASSLWPSHWHWSLQFALGLLLGETVEYWLHRLQHEVPWFWRFHAVHHSALRLYWLNAVRFHPIDVVFSAVGRTVPLALLGADAALIATLTVFSAVHAAFQHCNIPVRLGPLNWIFSMAELHRWHHSRRIEESNTNYGGDLIIWDILCGTRALPPDRDPPVDVGMSGPTHYPMSFWQQVLSPFRWKKILDENAP